MEARATRSAPSLTCNSLKSTLRTVTWSFHVSDTGSIPVGVLNVIDAIFRQGQSRTLTHPWRLFTLEQLSV